ncbi:CRE-SRH-308 protein [Caenorhabditis remanei]|uniref:CRE-SRH-308 protein n=1 Tax=Caenorhabditis remanei TaxID=31234 RepID=E3LIW8_CAERE|nr:CRE-SRH-308 protein [Caenorhabditis remanei]
MTFHFMSAIQIPIHIFGTYFVIEKTPKSMENVKFSMLLVHFTSVLFDIEMSIFAIPIIIFPITSGYPLGVWYYMGVPTWLMTYTVLTTLTSLGPAIVMFFENQYNYLVRVDSETQSRKIKRAFHYFINYFLSFTTCVPPFFLLPTSEEARHIAREKLPCLPSRIVDNLRLFMLGSEKLLGTCIAIFLIISWAQVILLFFGTAQYLFKAKIMSRQTSRLQKQFFKAICLQITIPFIVITIPAVHVVSTIFTGNLDLVYSQLSVIVTTTHGLCLTLIVLGIHKPYRDETMKILTCKNVTFAKPSHFLSNSRVHNYK